MPGMPLMPGVMMCEAAAQMCSYYAHKHNLLGDCKVVGFGGMEDVRFRDPVRPGDRLVVVCKMLKVRPGAIIVCRFQEFVGQSMVADGKIKGIPLPVDALTGQPKARPPEPRVTAGTPMFPLKDHNPTSHRSLGHLCADRGQRCWSMVWLAMQLAADGQWQSIRARLRSRAGRAVGRSQWSSTVPLGPAGPAAGNLPSRFPRDREDSAALAGHRRRSSRSV